MNRAQRRQALRRFGDPLIMQVDELEAYVRRDRQMAEEILDWVAQNRDEIPPDHMARVVESFTRRLADIEHALTKFPVVVSSRLAKSYALCMDFKATQVNGLKQLGVTVQ